MATKAIVGEKVGMTQVWDEAQRVVPVTMVKVAPVRVVRVKTPEQEGYSALQVTYGVRSARASSTSRRPGHFAKAGVEPGVRLVELRLDDTSGYSVGQEIDAGILAAGDKIDVTAISKGKGFAGGMKRHNFKGQGARPRQPQEAPRPRLDRSLRHAGPGLQGHADGRPHGRGEGDDAQPRGRGGGPRARAHPRQGRRPRPARRDGPHPQRREGRRK